MRSYNALLCRSMFRSFVAPSRARFAPACLRLFGTKLFTEDHEWVELEEGSNIVTLGITDHAQNELGEIVFVELPGKGQAYKKGDTIGAVESVKASSAIYTPVSGEAVDANTMTEETPEIVNDSPESDGWLCKIAMSDKSELNDLMDREAYQKFVEALKEDE